MSVQFGVDALKPSVVWGGFDWDDGSWPCNDFDLSDHAFSYRPKNENDRSRDWMAHPGFERGSYAHSVCDWTGFPIRAPAYSDGRHYNHVIDGAWRAHLGNPYLSESDDYSDVTCLVSV